MSIRKDKIQSVLSKYDPVAIDIALERFRTHQKEKQSSNNIKNANREKALNNLFDFIEIYFPHYFTVEFGEQQIELINDIMKFKSRDKRKPIKISRALSRGFGKSTIMSLCGMLWLILRKDWVFCIMISSTLEAAKNFLRKVTEEISDNQKLIEDFPELNPAIDSKNQFVSWKDTDIVFRGGARIIAKGTLNAIRGQRHKNYRPSALIFDDIDEDAHVISSVFMERKYRWIDRSALKLGSAYGIDCMMAYTVISPNCVGEYIYNDKTKYHDWDCKKFKAIVTDENGVERSSWEKGSPLSILLKERESDPLTFAREKQNEVVAEVDQKFKGLVKTYHFNREDYSNSRLVLAVDLSLGKSETSDLSAIVGVQRTPEGKFKEIYSSIERRRPDIIVKDLLEALPLYPYEVCVIESNGNQDHFLVTFRMLLEEHNKRNVNKINIPIIPINNTGDKLRRITSTLQPLFASGWLEIRSDSKILYNQLENYPYTKVDGVDALCFAVTYLKDTEQKYVTIAETPKRESSQVSISEPMGKSLDQVMFNRRRKFGY